MSRAGLDAGGGIGSGDLLTFGTLALITAVGLLGPLLALVPSRFAPPVVIGEILAGVVIGNTGTRTLDPANPTLVFLAAIGFAILMFIVGTHVPVRDARIWRCARRGLWAAVVTFAIAALLAPVIAHVTDLHRPAVIAVLISSSSAAVILPIVQSAPLTEGLLTTMAWVTFADVVTIVAVPFVLATGTVADAAIGATLVVVAAALIGLVARQGTDVNAIERLRHASHLRGWALDLRVSLLVLFALAALAQHYKTSVLIAGFAAGVMVASLGPPRRVADQLIGLGEGFFVPLFFVVLGAQLDLRALVRSGDDMKLFAILTLAAAVVPVLAALVTRIRIGYAMLATAKLGVPVAIVTIGLGSTALTPAQGSAIVAAAAASLVIATVGAAVVGVNAWVTPAPD